MITWDAQGRPRVMLDQGRDMDVYHNLSFGPSSCTSLSFLLEPGRRRRGSKSFISTGDDESAEPRWKVTMGDFSSLGSLVS